MGVSMVVGMGVRNRVRDERWGGDGGSAGGW